MQRHKSQYGWHDHDHTASCELTFLCCFLQEACRIEWVPWLLKVPKEIKYYIFPKLSATWLVWETTRSVSPRLSRLCQTLGVILSKLGQTRFMLPTALHEFTTYLGLRWVWPQHLLNFWNGTLISLHYHNMNVVVVNSAQDTRIVSHLPKEIDCYPSSCFIDNPMTAQVHWR